MSLFARPLLTKPRLIGLALAAAIFSIDQWLKWLVRVPLNLDERGVIDLIPFFDLRWTENYGISLGLLTAESMEMRWLLVALTLGISVVVLIWLCREKLLGDIIPLGLVLGGALGNIRDRVLYGYVVDYADLHFGEFRPFLIFNLADAAITIGVLIILARSFLSREKQEPAIKADASNAAQPASES
jgi:signal peptidase II